MKISLIFSLFFIFFHQCFAQVTDTIVDSRDGKVYKTVAIGKQTWLAENMNFETKDSWCYDDSAKNCNIYGRLYIYESALKACPSRWHLPTDAEWMTLMRFLGSDTTVGGKLRESGTAHWDYSDSASTNSSGFTAIAGGYRYYWEAYSLRNFFAYWWASTEYNATKAWLWYIYCSSKNIYRDVDSKSTGASVRCVKN
jgi:uncharacterized protein (TIGR02145 family)